MSLTGPTSGSDPSGEMDDVLDHLCSLYNCGSIHRHVPLLVSPALSPLYWFRLCSQNTRFPIRLISFSSFHCRLPFYYELKIAFVVWLLSPYTKGSSVLYRKFVHPTLSSKEKVKSFPLSVRLLTHTAIQ